MLIVPSRIGTISPATKYRYNIEKTAQRQFASA